MCSLLQVRLLMEKRPPHHQPSTTTGHPVTTWTPSCSSSAKWPGRGMSSVSVWRWHRPGPPSTTAGANPTLPAKSWLLLFFSPFSSSTFLWLMTMNLSTLMIYIYFFAWMQYIKSNYWFKPEIHCCQSCRMIMFTLEVVKETVMYVSSVLAAMFLCNNSLLFRIKLTVPCRERAPMLAA